MSSDTRWKYSATVVVRDNRELFRALKPDFERSADSRARMNLRLEGNDVVVDVEATDISALRSRLNGIAKLVSVYEDIQSVAKDV